MRKYVLLLAGACFLVPALASAQAAETKPQPPAVAKPAAKEVKVPEKVLQTYVGEYELRADWILTVTLKDGSLWGQPTNQNPQKLVADSETKFHLETLPVTLEFKKDDKGAVTSVYMIQEGRGERDLKKIK